MIRYVLFHLLISLAGEKVCSAWFWNHFFALSKSACGGLVRRVCHFVQPWSSLCWDSPKLAWEEWADHTADVPHRCWRLGMSSASNCSPYRSPWRPYRCDLVTLQDHSLALHMATASSHLCRLRRRRNTEDYREFTYRGLVMPYADNDLGQHSLG